MKSKLPDPRVTLRLRTGVERDGVVSNLQLDLKYLASHDPDELAGMIAADMEDSFGMKLPKGRYNVEVSRRLPGQVVFERAGTMGITVDPDSVPSITVDGWNSTAKKQRPKRRTTRK